LKSGVTVESLAERIQDAIPDLFRVEWEPVRELSPSAKLMLAIVATDRFPRTAEGLAEILKEPPEEVADLAARGAIASENSGVGGSDKRRAI
jgi:FPC/CPF motif-containing protein YcgG